MRIPLSFGELSIIRSLARLIVPVAGLALIMAMLYAGTVWMERMLTKKDEIVESIPTTASFVDADGELNLPGSSEYLFPYRTELESVDGRRLEAVLLARPSKNEIIFQRTSDDRVFALGLDRFSPDSQSMLSEFPAPGGSLQELELFRMIYPERFLVESGLRFPHECTLVNTEGRTLAVILLERPTADEVTLRRKIDKRVFTIPLSRLIESDRKFIRLFDTGESGNTSDYGFR